MAPRKYPERKINGWSISQFFHATQQKTKDLFAPQLFFLGEIDETFELLHLLGKTVGPPTFVTVFVDIENQIFTDLSLPLHSYILLSTISWWVH